MNTTRSDRSALKRPTASVSDVEQAIFRRSLCQYQSATSGKPGQRTLARLVGPMIQSDLQYVNSEACPLQ